ncbi:MAG: hypothetical protein ACJ74H_07720 [Thermoanaerobaculia bacterium]
MEKLRVGVVLESFAPPAWIARAIANVAEHAVLAAVYRSIAAPSPRYGWLTSLYMRVDAAKFRTADDALAPQDLSALLAHLPSHADDLDVIIAFAPPPRGAHARLGIWSIEIPDGVREMTTRQTHTVSVLRNLTDNTILGTARVATDAISLHRAMNRLRWKTASLIPRVLFGVRRPQPPLSSPPATAGAPRAPLLSIIRNFAAQKLRDIAMHEQWMVAFSFDSHDPRAFHRIEPPKDRLWADPFVIQDGDRAWIFVEEMRFVEGRGVLAVIEARRDGTWSPPVRILERPYHLSYPCVFRWNGAFYMVPETGGSRSVQLFRASDFPYRWEQVSELLRDIDAVDATPFEHEGRWWMYLTTPSTPNVYDELSLHTAATPEGPWTPHRLNPVLSDLAGGRCAGRPFERHGTLVRAAQDSAKRYGHSMELREIVTLTDDAWEERVTARILPNWTRGLVGTHTLNVDGEVTVIDGARDRLR